MDQESQISGNLIKRNGQIGAVKGAKKQKVLKNQILLARDTARQILRESEDLAAEIRKKALEESEELRYQAHNEGTERALCEFESNLIESREIRERVWRETEKDLLRLAVRLAEKIVGHEIKTDSETIANIVATALQNARQQEKLTVHLNPSDLPAVEKKLAKFSPIGRVRFLDFVADPLVSSGGCLIESEVSTIDARLETQLRVLERALLSQSEGEGSFD